MAQVTMDDIKGEAALRRERIKAFITADPPMPFRRILQMEGMCERPCRIIIRELEGELGLSYFGTPASREPKGDMPFGLTTATGHLRARLGDHLFQLRNRGKNHDVCARNEVAPRVGLNARAQLRAEQRPFAHDWKLSEIERLARELGENPRELLLKCLTT